MITANLVLLVISSVANIALGVLAFTKAPENASNRLFALLTLSLVSWTTVDFFTGKVTNPENTVIMVELLLTLVVFQNIICFFFVSYFPDGVIHFNRKRLILFSYGLLSVLAFGAAVTGQFFEGYTLAEGVANPAPTPFIVLFSLHALASTVGAFTILGMRIKKSKGIKRNQLRFLLLASVLLFAFVPIVNFILPLIFEVTWLRTYTPQYTLVFAGVIAYTMIRHNLLDFGTVIAKTTTYALTIASLLFIYIIVGIGGTNLLVSRQEGLSRDIIIFSVALGLSFSVNPLKNFFDRVTNRIFFKERYDPQRFIDAVNQALVSHRDIETLLGQTASIVKNNLKVSDVVFYLVKSGRSIGANLELSKNTDFEVLAEVANTAENRLYAIDSTRDINKPLDKALRTNGFRLVIKLLSNLNDDNQVTGYLFIGPKLNGDLFSLQDKKILEITANETVIATENILRYEEIEQFNVTLQKKIDDATRKLKQTNEKLLALDQAKDEFVSMASHQLRTPLTSIKGYLSMVLEGDAGKVSETQQQMLGQAFFSSQRMVYLISDLLNVSRLRTGKFIIDSKPTNLADLVESEVNQLHDGAKAKDLTLAYTKPKKFPELMLDDMKIRQVIMNFTDNAIYYTPSGGKITVKLKDTPTAVEFIVHDNGIGVPKEQQHKLFTKFYRADNARKTRPDGTGLGIFMAKKVIVAQGGSIIFDSKEGKGSTFGFSFPKEKLLTDKQTDKK